ncbi:hypothetical protein BY458DRAFT_489240 [Sporodiniella umbellata]|nr:hypothetical protein BY458DRAFT_489240 [Sporodiniella umbellata]
MSWIFRTPITQLKRHSLLQLRFISHGKKALAENANVQEIEEYRSNMVSINPEYKHQIEQPKTFYISKSLSDFCTECGQILEFSKHKPLSNPSKHLGSICVGCKRLFEKCLLNENIKSFIKSRLQFNTDTGANKFSFVNLNDYHNKTLDFMARESFRVLLESTWTQTKAKQVRKNLKKRRSFSRELATKEQIMQLIIHSNSACAASNALGFWLPIKSDPFAITIDHIVPLSKGGTNAIENLRPMYRCLNHVKADVTEKEFYRWFFNCRNSV